MGLDWAGLEFWGLGAGGWSALLSKAVKWVWGGVVWCDVEDVLGYEKGGLEEREFELAEM